MSVRSFDGKGDGLLWPKDEHGEAEEAVFLVSTPDLAAYDEVLISKLRAYGIPAVTRYPKDGEFGRVYLGFSGYGADIYVPASRLDEAKELLENDAGDAPDEEE